MTTEPVTYHVSFKEFQDFAKESGWLPMKLSVKEDKISTIYLTKEGFSLYADFDPKTLNLISNVDRR
jgi:hypothetical protein